MWEARRLVQDKEVYLSSYFVSNEEAYNSIYFDRIRNDEYQLKSFFQRSAWVEFSKELRFAIDCTAGDSKPNPDKEGPTSASRSTSKGGSKSLLDDHSHPYGIIEDKEKDSAYAQFNESVSGK